jgi:hypothetical protein
MHMPAGHHCWLPFAKQQHAVTSFELLLLYHITARMHAGALYNERLI